MKCQVEIYRPVSLMQTNYELNHVNSKFVMTMVIRYRENYEEYILKDLMSRFHL